MEFDLVVLTITICFATDCKNINCNKQCTVNHEFAKGRCLQYGINMDKFNSDLKDYLNNKEKLRGNKTKSYSGEHITKLEELDRILDKKIGDNNAI